jgi:lipoprotein-anchoring transpeptidase ErfK/SrfK
MGKHDTTSRFRLRAVAAAGLVALGVLGAVGTAQAETKTIKDTPCSVGVRACVDVDEKQAWLISPEGEIDRGPVDISPGAEDTPSPRGNFRVQWKHKDHYSKEYDAPMPWSTFFAPGGIAFHEGNLDNPSGGCIRLEEEDAKAFFNYLSVGDRVQVV